MCLVVCVLVFYMFWFVFAYNTSKTHRNITLENFICDILEFCLLYLLLTDKILLIKKIQYLQV